MLMLAYGYSTRPANDPLVQIAEDAMKGFAKASEPGAFMVDRFPFRAPRFIHSSSQPQTLIQPPVKYVPAWLPGAGFQRVAQAMRADLERLYDVPYAFVRRELVRASRGVVLFAFNRRICVGHGARRAVVHVEIPRREAGRARKW